MATKLTRDEYVERVTGWHMPDRDDPELAAEARARGGLDGVYDGTSARIRRLITLAHLRGVRRGASSAWEAQQPIVLRAASAEKLEEALRKIAACASDDGRAEGDLEIVADEVSRAVLAEIDRDVPGAREDEGGA